MQPAYQRAIRAKQREIRDGLGLDVSSRSYLLRNTTVRETAHRHGLAAHVRVGHRGDQAVRIHLSRIAALMPRRRSDPEHL